MQTTEQTTHRRPFHETIVDAIHRADSLEEMRHLAMLIKATKIPKGHYKIIVAWNNRCLDKDPEYLEVVKEGEEENLESYILLADLLADLMEQEREAAKEEKAKVVSS